MLGIWSCTKDPGAMGRYGDLMEERNARAMAADLGSCCLRSAVCYAGRGLTTNDLFSDFLGINIPMLA